MAKKKSTAKRVVYRTREKIRFRTRTAPKRRAALRVRRRDDNIDLKKIVRGSVSVAIGMVIAKAAVNKLTEGGNEQIRWTWPNIAMAAASSIVAAFALGAVFKLKKPTVGLIAAGGVSLALYKAFTCKLAPKWGWSETWFGADEDAIHPDFLGAGNPSNSAIDVYDYEPADVGEATSYWGADATNSGGQVVPMNPAMGADDYGSIADLRRIGARVAQSYPGSY